MKIAIFAVILLVCMSCSLGRRLFKTEFLDGRLARFHIAPPEFSLDEVIHAAARKHQISSALVKSIIAAESGFSPQVVSSKGAVGLMQLMPETARELGADPTVPEQNIDAGAHYLSTLLKRFSNKKKNALPAAIAAYNAGPGAVERFHGVPPYRETRTYVTRVLRYFDQYAQQEGTLVHAAAPPRRRPILVASSARLDRRRGRRASGRAIDL